MSLGIIDSNLPSDLLLQITQAQSDIAGFGPDLGGVMDFIAERMQSLTKARGAIVELAEGEDMVYRATAGIAKSQLGLRLQRQRSLSGACIAERRILFCDDTEADERVDRNACRRAGLRSMVVAPLRHNDTIIGALKIASDAAAAFTDQDIRVLDLMGGLIAAAMFHAAHCETDELYRQATHDPLTGLPNRALFYDRLRQSMMQAGRRDTGVAVIHLDMDGLKPINDNLGHRAGDAAIRELAKRLRRVLRQSDTTARLSGDEFGAILTEILDPIRAEACVARIAGEIRRPFQFENQPLDLAASIGYAVYPLHANDLDTLIDRADEARSAVNQAATQGLRQTLWDRMQTGRRP